MPPRRRATLDAAERPRQARRNRNTQSIIGLVLALILAGVSAMAIFQPVLGGLPGVPQALVREPSLLPMATMGLAIGCFGTIVGIGGGPLIMPILLTLFVWPTDEAVATSLFVVFLNALSGSLGYFRQGRIDTAGGIRFSLAAIPGAVLVSWLHHRLHITSFSIIFGVFLLLLALFSLARARGVIDDRGTKKRRSGSERRVRIEDVYGEKFDFYSNDTLGVALNAVLGLAVGFLGIGGGVLQVPLLLYVLRYPPHIATATSHFVTMITAAAALLPHIYLGNVHFGAALWMGVGVVLGAQVGAEWARRLRSATLIYLFSGVLLFMAVRLFLN